MMFPQPNPSEPFLSLSNPVQWVERDWKVLGGLGWEGFDFH